MNESGDRDVPTVRQLQRIIALASRRLEGHWEDPAAWRVLCEEVVLAWRQVDDVLWALLCPRGAIGTVPPRTGTDDQAVLWSVATDELVWCDNPLPAEVWTGLDSAPSGLLAGSGPAPLATNPEAELESPAAGWLAAAVESGDQAGLSLVLGLARLPQDDLASDAVAIAMVDVADGLAPLLGQRRQLVDVATESVAIRSECETLSRLGELRKRLAAVTAHELKTPLTSITAYAEVLEQRTDDPTFTHAPEFLRVIRAESDRLLRLVDRLLDSTRRGRGQALAESQPVLVDQLVVEVMRAMAPQASARNLQLVDRIPEALPAIDGDDDLVRQVLVNLLGNAFKFTPAGGRVVLAAREDTSSVRLAVSDNGAGIPPRELRAIFQSFYRTRTARQVEGLGLGLSIVKEITALHGGHLDVSSRVGRGTTFSVLLPKLQQVSVENTWLLGTGLEEPRLERILGLGLRLVAELAAARGVLVMVPDADDERLVAAAAMGLGEGVLGVASHPGDGFQRALTAGPWLGRLPATLLSACDERLDALGSAMLAPFPLDGSGRRGVVVVSRRLSGGEFGTDDLSLLQVLAEVLGNTWVALLDPDADRNQHDRVTEALAALTGLRRGGVPTTDPLALRLLTRTGRRLGLSSYEIRLLQYAGALHDAGMLILDPEVVQKPEVLDIDERDHVGAHPQRGLDLLGPLAAAPDLQRIIRHHHERVDGRGYPEGRRGDDIPLGSRIIAVVDAFFAMVRSRPWREGMPVAAAVDELQRHAGAQFDARVVASFIQVLTEEGLVSDEPAPSPVETPSGR
jgi:signal transduction histidine kinase